MTSNFDWLTREAVYEPAPIPRPSPIPLGRKVFLTLSVLAMITGALIAVGMR